MPGPPSEVYLKCLEEVQAISCATLFAPVTRQEAVQAMSTYCSTSSDYQEVIELSSSPRFGLV